MVSKEIEELSKEYLKRSLSKEGQKISRENRKRILREFRKKEGIFSPEENKAWN